jgi:hypothetical protein
MGGSYMERKPTPVSVNLKGKCPGWLGIFRFGGAGSLEKYIYLIVINRENKYKNHVTEIVTATFFFDTVDNVNTGNG